MGFKYAERMLTSENVRNESLRKLEDDDGVDSDSDGEAAVVVACFVCEMVVVVESSSCVATTVLLRGAGDADFLDLISSDFWW